MFLLRLLGRGKPGRLGGEVGKVWKWRMVGAGVGGDVKESADLVAPQAGNRNPYYSIGQV